MGRNFNAAKSYFGETSISAHEEKIVQFLYDEGPHLSEDLSEHLGLSRDHTATILTNLRQSGRITIIHLGKRGTPHWILSEDA